jgi:hypothetical protein
MWQTARLVCLTLLLAMATVADRAPISRQFSSRGVCREYAGGYSAMALAVTPEQKSRQLIDALLTHARWAERDETDLNRVRRARSQPSAATGQNPGHISHSTSPTRIFLAAVPAKSWEHRPADRTQ